MDFSEQPVAVLVGFHYTVDQEKKLPGTLVDLYMAYSLAKTKGFLTYVVTDIQEDFDCKLLQASVAEGTIDTSATTFISQCRKDGILFPTLGSIFEIIADSWRLLFYYSGHFEQGSIVEPLSSSDFPSHHLLELFTARLHDINFAAKGGSCRKQVFCIMDCCCGDGLMLPFLLDAANNKFLLDVDSPDDQTTSITFQKRWVADEIICCSASSGLQQALSQTSGSQHSKELFRLLKDGKTALREFPGHVHAAFPHIKKLWSWLS